MAINLSKLITKIKMRMGIYGLTLPIDNPDKYIMDTLEIITIPTFSIYQPYYEHLHANTENFQKNEELSNNEMTAYILPSFETRKLIAVVDVKYDTNASAYYTGIDAYSIAGLSPYGGSTLMQQIMLSNVRSQTYGQMYPKITFDFLEPCTLMIYNQLISNSLDITLSFEHHKSLATIPQTAEKSFFELALYDCMINFYQIAKRWNTIESIHGSINLNIEDWADAENKRTELLNDWDNLYHLDIPDSVVYK